MDRRLDTVKKKRIRALQRLQGQQVSPFEIEDQSLNAKLLHGTLDICIKEAKKVSKLGNRLGKIKDHASSKIKGRADMAEESTSGWYVRTSVSGAVVRRTFVVYQRKNLVWMQHFKCLVAHHAAEVFFIVKKRNVLKSTVKGAVAIPVDRLLSGEKIEGNFPILDSSRKPCKVGAVLLSLSIQFSPIQNVRGVVSCPDDNGISDAYFPLRRGGKVTLYQDAHAYDGCLPNFELDGGVQFNHASCWQDIHNAISQAQRLIYIAGWSVYHTVRLLRDSNNTCTLGDLLKNKSREGVRVLLLVWDDPTSWRFMGYIMDGIMKTNDEETRLFFENSSVQILLCHRRTGEERSFLKRKASDKIYSHHQKTVIVDAEAGQSKRKIVAFVGGLDLCKGRYDTPKHPLFRTLETIHKDDVHNPSFVEPGAGGPREPWHDLHCQIDGPAAYDILTNFKERWLKAFEEHWLKGTKHHGLRKLKPLDDDALLNLEKITDILTMEEVSSLYGNDPENWNVQVFRSIDSNSVKGFPDNPTDASSKNLVCGRNVVIDMSIHTAYVEAIRAAQRFIYIENQFFVGSSYNWEFPPESGAKNLIPMEIALKIANKIQSNERFAAYILIPMWPEGDSAKYPANAILSMQHQTMQMMYETIYEALVKVGLENSYKPQDYLNFFCLGNRESLDGVDSSNGKNSAPANTPQALCQKNRRFQIYVHSKCMIVDDEYVILGSANINDRSMDGTRDTEIAMGAYQPHHTWARKFSSPHGQVYGYRMSLWAEHIGEIEECFNRPESLECVRRVRSLSKQNWRQYAADKVTEMKGHLLKYPVKVDETGKVKHRSGLESFPDVGGKILGNLPLSVVRDNITS